MKKDILGHSVFCSPNFYILLFQNWTWNACGLTFDNDCSFAKISDSQKMILCVDIKKLCSIILNTVSKTKTSANFLKKSLKSTNA